MAEFNPQLQAFDVWRSVGGQHQVSKMVLVDTLDKQALLEQLLEQSKPALPDTRGSLHYRLAKD